MNQSVEVLDKVVIEDIPMAAMLPDQSSELVIDQLLEHYIAEMKHSGEIQSRWIVEPSPG